VHVCGVSPCVFVVRDSVGGRAQCMYVVRVPVFVARDSVGDLNDSSKFLS